MSTHLPKAPECPFCRGGHTEMMSLFGSHASLATYWCRDCRSPFELLRWRDDDGDERPGPDQPSTSSTSV